MTRTNCPHDFLRTAEDMPVSQLLDGLRVLLLEDEYLIAMDVEELCHDNGATEVILVRDLGEIDAGTVAGTIDVAIIDLMLGGVSTLDFARRLREAGVPFVFASGYSDADDLGEAFPDAVLVAKPYASADLIGAVASVCGRIPPA